MLQVIFVGTIGVAYEFKTLVEAVSEEILPRTGGGPALLSADADLGVGLWLVLSASLVTYVAQLLTAAQAAVLDVDGQTAPRHVSTFAADATTMSADFTTSVA